MLVDKTGNWVFYQITDYKDTQNAATLHAPPAAWCTDSQRGLVPCLQVIANPGDAALNAPGGQRNLTNPVTLVVGLQYAALRVCDGWLEQKVGIFNPATDANCPALAAGAAFPPYVTKAGWSPLLPNVEDLQFAYVFADGTVGNGPGGHDGDARRSADRWVATRRSPPLDIRRVVGHPRHGHRALLDAGDARGREGADAATGRRGPRADRRRGHLLPLPAFGNVAAAQPGCGVLTMADTRNCRTSPDERGIALVMVILLLLVLTVLGITATMLMTQEDRISSRQETQKARSTPPTPGCGGARRSCF